mgnify:CR=1 FL=1
MHKQISNPEKVIDKSWLAKQLGLQSALVHYYAIKLQLRYFKYSGARYKQVNRINYTLPSRETIV